MKYHMYLTSCHQHACKAQKKVRCNYCPLTLMYDASISEILTQTARL